MRPLDALLLEANCAARIRTTQQMRDIAVREIQKIPFPTAEEVGQAKAEAARGLRHLVQALAKFSNDNARDQLGAAIAIAAKAILIEPDAPRAKPAPKQVQRRVPTGSENSQRTPYYLRD